MDFPDSQTCLVTGATGFVGLRLCQRLSAQGHHVIGLARRESEGPWHSFLRKDLAAEDVASHELMAVDTVFHLAAKVHQIDEFVPDEDSYHQANVRSTVSLLNVSRQVGVKRFVFVSSVQAVGTPGVDIVDETFTNEPMSPYGKSKRAAEAHVINAAGPGFHAAVARPCLVYGPGVKANLKKMIEAIGDGRFPPMPRTNNRRSLVHVEDLTSALILCASHPNANGEVFFVTDGNAYSTREIYDLIREALGKSEPPLRVPQAALRSLARVGDTFEALMGRRFVFDSDAFARLFGSAHYDSSKIQRQLGFVPQYSLHQSVGEMVTSTSRKS